MGGELEEGDEERGDEGGEDWLENPKDVSEEESPGGGAPPEETGLDSGVG